MFSIGEYLPVKIINIEAREKGIHVEGSFNPREIYLEQNHNSFKKGMLVWGSISSQADHGYEISLGVKNCRAFLPSKNINNGTEYSKFFVIVLGHLIVTFIVFLVIGKPLWCVIHKFDSTPSASTVRMSATTEHIKNTKFDIESMHGIIPGMKVEFVTDKVLRY